MKVTKYEMVICPQCSGLGWVSAYHNETKDCPRCKGEQRIEREIPLSSEELQFNLKEKFGTEPLDAVSLFQVLEIHRSWLN